MSRPSPPRVLGLPAGHVLHPAPGQTLLAAARLADVPLASSCVGRGICGDCVVRVLEGTAALAPPDEIETAWRRRTGRGSARERLGCRATATGDAVITTPYW